MENETRFENIGEAKEIELPFGKFMVISRTRITEKDVVFISIRKGRYFTTKDGSTGKQFLQNISFGVGEKEKVIEALKEV